MKTGDRFKVGDKVVKISDEWDGIYRVGDIGTVTQVDGDGLPWARLDREQYEFHDPDDTELDCIDQRDWELVEIANSPLFKALK